MGQVYEIDHHHHAIAAWEAAAESAGLALDWRLEAGFGEPERADLPPGMGKIRCFPK